MTTCADPAGDVTQALSGSDGTLDTIDAAKLDAHWAVDTRSALLLVQAYARLRAELPERTPGGRVVMMTSGQDHGGGMPGEMAYALQKGALASITRSLSTTLAAHAVTVNTVNPGPVDTDYLTGEAYDTVEAMFPAGRWGMPDEPPHRLAGDGRGGLDHRSGDQLRRRLPALIRGPTARPPGRPAPASPAKEPPCARP